MRLFEKPMTCDRCNKQQELVACLCRACYESGLGVRNCPECGAFEVTVNMMLQHRRFYHAGKPNYAPETFKNRNRKEKK